MQEKKEILELTILIPCLNEEGNITSVLHDACTFLEQHNIQGEVLLVDNGSTDGSVDIARSFSVRIVTEPKKGYGNALHLGIQHARGIYTIIGDCDSTYSFCDLLPFLESLRNGNHLVVGNRFAGGIEKDAMPFLHRYIGIPFLSWLGRVRYHVAIKDFHCGLRGFYTEDAKNLPLKSEGMEFATELIACFARSNLPIAEIPTTLSVSKYPRHSHLHTLRDGLRHLVYIVLHP